MWSLAEIKFDLVYEQTEDVIVTVDVATPVGAFQCIAEVEEQGRRLVLRRFSIQSEDLGPNGLGPTALRWVAQATMEQMDYDEIIIEGSPRNTGAGKGRTPKPIRFARRPRPQA